MSVLSQPGLQDEWKSAVKECEAKFSPEDLDEVRKSKGPDDILDFIKDVEAKESNSKLSRLMGQIRQFGRSFKAYEHGLDLIAQGTPFPGCIIWGSIRVVLAVRGTPFSLLRLQRESLQSKRSYAKWPPIDPGGEKMHRRLRKTTWSIGTYGRTL